MFLSKANDIANCWTDIAFLYSEAFYKSRKCFDYIGQYTSNASPMGEGVNGCLPSTKNFVLRITLDYCPFFETRNFTLVIDNLIYKLVKKGRYVTKILQSVRLYLMPIVSCILYMYICILF